MPAIVLSSVTGANSKTKQALDWANKKQDHGKSFWDKLLGFVKGAIDDVKKAVGGLKDVAKDFEELGKDLSEMEATLDAAVAIAEVAAATDLGKLIDDLTKASTAGVRAQKQVNGPKPSGEPSGSGSATGSHSASSSGSSTKSGSSSESGSSSKTSSSSTTSSKTSTTNPAYQTVNVRMADDELAAENPPLINDPADGLDGFTPDGSDLSVKGFAKLSNAIPAIVPNATSSEPTPVDIHDLPEFAAKTPTVCNQRYLSKDYSEHSAKTKTGKFPYYGYTYEANDKESFIWKFDLKTATAAQKDIALGSWRKDASYATELIYEAQQIGLFLDFIAEKKYPVGKLPADRCDKVTRPFILTRLSGNAPGSSSGGALSFDTCLAPVDELMDNISNDANGLDELTYLDASLNSKKGIVSLPYPSLRSKFVRTRPRTDSASIRCLLAILLAVRPQPRKPLARI